MPGYFSVKCTPTGAVVTSANDIGKQVFFSWGGGGVSAEFYGRSTGRRGARGGQWHWDLSKAGVAQMISNCRGHLSLYPKAHRAGAAARELLR